MQKEKSVFISSIQYLKAVFSFIKISKSHYLSLGCLLLTVALIQLPAPFLYKAIIDNVLPTKNESLLIIIVAGMISIEIFKTIFSIANTWILSKISHRLASNLRRELFKHYLSIPYKHFLETPTGNMVNRMVSDSNAVASFIQHILWVVPLPLLITFSGSMVMFFWNWKMALFILLTIPFTMIITKRLSHKLKSIRSDYRDAQENLQGQVNESIDNIRAIRAFSREKEFDKEVGDAVENFKNISISHFLNSSMLRSSNRIVEIGASYIFIIFGAWLTITKEITLGEFFAFKYFSEMIAPNFNHLFNYVTELPNQLVSIERIFEVLSIDEEKNRKQGYVSGNIRGKIEFKNTSLTYPDGTKALKKLNLEIKEGEIIAIIGPSGSGKTSIVSLLLGFYPITDGAIKIDENDLSELNIVSYRKRIGAIFQDAQLFDASIRENLLIGLENSVDDEEIWRALEFSNASEFIKELPDGLATIIGNRGIKLSGGQRQRLTIARVFLKNPSILIMDEATSALDSISEKEIQNEMKNISKGRTTILIAHRLSTIAMADRIVVMKDGEINEIGTQKELLAKGGLYKKLHSAQMDGFLKWEAIA